MSINVHKQLYDSECLRESTEYYLSLENTVLVILKIFTFVILQKFM